jgi:hypothetical protein
MLCPGLIDSEYLGRLLGELAVQHNKGRKTLHTSLKGTVLNIVVNNLHEGVCHCAAYLFR